MKVRIKGSAPKEFAEYFLDHTFKSEAVDDEIERFVLAQDNGLWKLFINGPENFSPIYFDLVKLFKKLNKEQKGFKSEPFAKALGFGKIKDLKILDCTGGKGQDALLAHYFGGNLTILERNPVNGLLLSDALGSLHREFSQESSFLQRKIQFHFIEAGEFLKEVVAGEFDTIYLDPMYEESHHKKSALSKKEMRVFQEIVGPDQDIAKVFELARKKAGKRIVVKRSLKAKELFPGVHHSYSGKSTRYDLYLPN